MRTADLMQAKLERLGNLSANLRRRGVCPHGWLQTPPGQSGTVCLDCGQAFQSFEAALEAGAAVLRGEE